MADANASNEQNRTEEATPFKLKRARERGMVARGVDLGFFSALAGLSIWAFVAAPTATARFAEMARKLLGDADLGRSPAHAVEVLQQAFEPVLQMTALAAATIAAVVIFFEIVQVRGLVFSATPLKPDFSRLDPAKNLRRLFSVRLLKETLKNILKLAAYAIVAWLVVRHQAQSRGLAITDAVSLSQALREGALSLLLGCLILALMFALIDQVIARGEFRKQMRMSRRELVKEAREREGDPRQKQKRKQLHREFTQRARGMGQLAGSDFVVVNPDHYAVALRYDPKSMNAPKITAKGRNHFALFLKRQAMIFAIPIYESPALARALYASRQVGQEVAAEDYRAVADLYLKRARLKAPETRHA
jgi:flagellar biosynthetic protein FlhB